MTLLDVKSLTIGFGKAPAVVEGVNFSVESGETLALVGESGLAKRSRAGLSCGFYPQTRSFAAGRFDITTLA